MVAGMLKISRMFHDSGVRYPQIYVFATETLHRSVVYDRSYDALQTCSAFCMPEYAI